MAMLGRADSLFRIIFQLLRMNRTRLEITVILIRRYFRVMRFRGRPLIARQNFLDADWNTINFDACFRKLRGCICQSSSVGPTCLTPMDPGYGWLGVNAFYFATTSLVVVLFSVPFIYRFVSLVAKKTC